jgi:hypothetical protein
MATRAVAGSVAKTAGKTTDEIYNDLAANTLPNSHLAPAGIVLRQPSTGTRLLVRV